MSFLFKNLRLLDPRWKEARAGYEVLVEGDTIKEVSAKPIKASKANVIDCGKRTLMPGLIDCHVHTHHSEVYINRMEAVPLTLMMARSTGRLKRMLDRGFTTVRDAGGADWGTKTAVEFGPDPRAAHVHLLPLDRPDRRPQRPQPAHRHRVRRACAATAWCSSAASPTARTPCARRAREQMRQGADQVKLMVSGGVASPYDPLESLQFTEEEITAAVEEAHAFGRYVLTHAYTPEAITRAVKCGVRTIEHGNLVDAPTAKLMAQKGVYMVPNLIAYDAMKRRAAELGMPKEMLDKNDEVLKYGFAELELCRKAGVRMAYGSDLLGALEDEQTVEFQIRGARHAGHRGHPLGDADRRRGRAPGRQARRRRARRLRRPAGGRRRSPEESRPVQGWRPAPVGHHEGRPFPQEHAVTALALIRRRARRWALNGAATVALAYILLPLIFVVWLAFFRQEIPSFPPEGYSLRWFAAILDQRKFVDGFSISFQVAALAMAVGLLLGVPAALCLARLQFQAARAARQPAADAASSCRASCWARRCTSSRSRSRTGSTWT